MSHYASMVGMPVFDPGHSVVATLYVRMPRYPLTSSKFTLLQHTCIVPWLWQDWTRQS
jgi:DNA-binding IclR family transcriptional regulator